MAPPLGIGNVFYEKLNALITKIGTYKEAGLVRKHIVEALKVFPNLEAVLGVIPDKASRGGQAHCIVLKGTVPVYFQGSKWNTPVGFWIPPEYPAVAPLSYVLPPKDTMFIRHNHPVVDSTGKVTIDYAQDWNHKSNLLGLVNRMCFVFSANPPLSSTRPSVTRTSLVKPSGTLYPEAQRGPYSSRQPLVQPESSSYMPLTYGSQTAAAKQALISTLSDRMRRDLLNRRAELAQFGSRISDEINDVYADLQQRQAVSRASDAEALKAQHVQMQTELMTIETQIKNLDSADAYNNVTQRSVVDDATDSMNASVRQVTRLNAENNALEDAMYAIYRAMADDEVDTAEGLRAIRKLAREQFYARALLWKVEQTRQHRAKLSRQAPAGM
ncbi:UEV domain [Carpediemonas membranifera]|uniref:UEV domain n=1 Tax=Carpediemonas membranifera TaxID=201153 RepID=A0A8J6E9B3_9EUKA|nr:UEV domain [Carpediemonas membranifera]QNO39392.1 vacuolar protein sorting 23C [Carpediemonas membranifera]|eukprot:KAG9393085.1 UEV domain [Carpediemonas membranifera]